MYAIRSYYEQGGQGDLEQQLAGALQKAVVDHVQPAQQHAEKQHRITSYNVCYTKLLRANSTALLSAVEAMPDRKTIITSAVEHPAILEVCEHLERKGYTIHRLAVNGQGQLDLAQYESLLSDDVALVSVMWANNETGTQFPVLKMASLAKAHGIRNNFV